MNRFDVFDSHEIPILCSAITEYIYSVGERVTNDEFEFIDELEIATTIAEELIEANRNTKARLRARLDQLQAEVSDEEDDIIH